MPARGKRVAGAAAALVGLGAVGLAARVALLVDSEPPSEGGARTLRAERIAALPDRRILVAGVSMAARAADRSRDCEGTLTVLARDVRGRVERASARAALLTFARRETTARRRSTTSCGVRTGACWWARRSLIPAHRRWRTTPRNPGA